MKKITMTEWREMTKGEPKQPFSVEREEQYFAALENLPDNHIDDDEGDDECLPGGQGVRFTWDVKLNSFVVAGFDGRHDA
jgi:hypothetical protein